VRSSLLLMISLLTIGCSGKGATLDSFLLEGTHDPYTLSMDVIPTFQELMIPTPDGEMLSAVFVEGTTRKDVTILYCHGNDSDLGDAWERMQDWYPLGYNLMAFDYRGYGRSTGTTTEPGVQIDTRTIRQALIDMFGIDPTRMVYYGHSFGGANCIDLASTDAPGVLISESTFTSAAALVSDGAGYDLPANFVTTLKFDSIDKIPRIFRPYLALHGTDDDYVQPKYSFELTQAHVDAGPTQLTLVQGAHHSDIPTVLGVDTYRTTLSNFIDANINK
jgi:fermentation-respiration switch protein FrsA (DUF1100 family)